MIDVPTCLRQVRRKIALREPIDVKESDGNGKETVKTEV
jgi:hypothetical protein